MLKKAKHYGVPMLKKLQSFEVNEKVAAEINALLHELSPNKKPEERTIYTADSLATILLNHYLHLYVYVNEAGDIVSMGSVMLLSPPSGKKAIIEDVVVLGAHRGKGYFSAIMKELHRVARDFGAPYTELTSDPENANRWIAIGKYMKMGYLKHSQHMRLKL